jgi:hypothetical protein
MSKKQTIILIAALGAAYFFFTKARKKGGKQNTSPLTPQPNPQNNTIGSVKPGASTAGSQKKSFADYLNSVLGLFNKGSKGGSGIKVGGGGSSGGGSKGPSIETQPEDTTPDDASTVDDEAGDALLPDDSSDSSGGIDDYEDNGSGDGYDGGIDDGGGEDYGGESYGGYDESRLKPRARRNRRKHLAREIRRKIHRV